jgi:hypothetical protein
MVLATDTRTGKTEAEKVTTLWVNYDSDLMDVTVKTAGETSTIKSTQHHLFWDLSTGAWVQADDLTSGTALQAPTGATATVVSTTVVPGAADMWDLTVSNDHDFYVVVSDGSPTSVLVHNCPAGQGQPFDENQQAIVQLAKTATRTGISPDDFSTLSDWADEYGLSSRGPEIHPDGEGWASENWHGHIGPVNHIPVTGLP